MIKALISIAFIIYCISTIYKAISGNAAGPFTKDIQLLWEGEIGRGFGKLVVIGIPLIILMIIQKML